MENYTNNINHSNDKKSVASGSLGPKEKSYQKNSEGKGSKYYKRLPFAGNRLGNEIGKLSLSASGIDNQKPTSSVDNVTWDIEGAKDSAGFRAKKKMSVLGEFKEGNISRLNNLKGYAHDSGDTPLGTREKKKKKLAFASNSLTQKIPYTFNFNKNFIFCKESRIESPTSFYGAFHIGPFDESLGQTLAHNIRRTLLSELTGLAITSVEIDGVLHKFSSIPGVKETVLDILCNLQTLVFKKAQGLSGAHSNAQKAYGETDYNPLGTQALCDGSETIIQTLPINQIAFLRVRGPGIVKASDIILSTGIECVNPEQYIATLAEDGILNMKIYINEGKNAIKQTQKQVVDQGLFESTSHLGRSVDRGTSVDGLLWGENSEEDSEARPGTISETPWDSNNSLKSNRIYLDSVFMPVTKVNAFVESNFKATDDLLEKNINYTALKSKTITEITQKYKKDLSENVLGVGSTIPEVETFFPLNGGQSAEIVEQALSNIFFSFQPPCTPNTLASYVEKKTVGKPIDKQYRGSEVSDDSPSQKTCLDLNIAFGLVDSMGPPEKRLTAYAPDFLGPQIIISDATKMHLGSGTAGPLAVLQQPTRQCNIVIEIWTNGSIHPRLALKQCLEYLTTTFITLNNVKMLGSMYKSDLTYMKILGRKTFYTSK